MSNEMFQAIAVIVTLAHVCALAGSFFFLRRFRPVLVLNLLVSAGVLIGLVPTLPSEIAYAARADLPDIGDFKTLLFCLFELGVLGAAVLALRSVRIPAAVHWIGFGINFSISVFFLAFAFLFEFKCCGYL